MASRGTSWRRGVRLGVEGYNLVYILVSWVHLGIMGTSWYQGIHLGIKGYILVSWTRCVCLSVLCLPACACGCLLVCMRECARLLHSVSRNALLDFKQTKVFKNKSALPVAPPFLPPSDPFLTRVTSSDDASTGSRL